MAVIFALRPKLAAVAGLVLHAPTREMPGADLLGQLRIELITAPSVALVILVTATALSAFKPWGRTPYGRRTTRRVSR